MKPLLILAAVIFSVVAVGGLAALRGLSNLALRAIVFLALCYVALTGSIWLSIPWDLDPVELGYAWAVALLVVVIVEAIIRTRRHKGSIV